MAASFLTHHGTFLCFGDGGTDFQHLPVDRLGEAALVLADADPALLRAGDGDATAVAIRPASSARVGLPRALGIGRGKRAATVSLEWRDNHLCAGGEGGTIFHSPQVNAWEEFLPLASDDVALLRAFFDAGWESLRDRRRFGRGEIRPVPDFMLRAGDLAIDLRLQASLGGRDALDAGRASLLIDGWRIETLRRYEPLVVWRHDGSEHADDEIVLGLRSLVDQRAFDGRVLIQTRLERDDLLERVPGLQDLPIHVRRPPDERRGLLPWPLAGKDETPVLYLANGITCRGSLQPLLRALAVENEVALLPCVWTAERSTSGESDASLFFDDPAEPSTAVACSAAVIGVPNRTHSDRLHRLISMVAANRLTPATITDRWEDDLLRYVVAREGGANTRLLSRYVSDARADQAAPKLLNFRPLPSAIRLAAMRGALEAAA